MKIQLGFEDHSYVARYSPQSPLAAAKKVTKGGKIRKMTSAQASYGQGKTTGDVANDLEKKFGIVEKFWEMEEDGVIKILETSYATSIESMMMGQPPLISMLATKDTDKLIDRFKKNLTYRRYDGVIAGVPTRSAVAGVSHLRRDPYKSGRGSRPSFIDTGMYQQSFTVWEEP
jgi:hypothetical protein